MRHQPAWVQQERHVHNQINAFKDFCDARRLPLMAAVPLATGEVLDSAHLTHPDMPPVQAALHWNVTQGVAVIPGVDCISNPIPITQTLTLSLPKPKPQP